MKFELYDHNRIAYDSAVEMMEMVGKAAIIHPTGTGKSFIGFQLAADHPNEQILWLSPSRYIFETQMENLAAESGETSCNDAVESGETSCSSAEQGCNEMWSRNEAWDGNEAQSRVLDNIEFLTYARLMLMDADEISELHPAYIILDEFHCCGAQMWGQGVQRLLDTYPDVPILGLSATNIRYLDNQRDMAQELFDGHIASEITLGEAIVRGILNPPKYVLSIFKYQDDLKKYEARVRGARSKAVRDEGERYLEALRRALENADGLDVIFDKHMTNRTGKYIVFCANKEHMDEMMGHLEWFAKVDQHPHVYSLYAADPSTSKEFDDFKADNDNSHLRLLYCIDALNQGIHVPDISGVILLRPTVSPIIYKQQIGRALSATKHRKAAGALSETKYREADGALSATKYREADGVHLDRAKSGSEQSPGGHQDSAQSADAQSDSIQIAGGQSDRMRLDDSCSDDGSENPVIAATDSSMDNQSQGAVIFDIVMNIENLYSIGSIEEEMEIATAYYRSLGESEYVVNERFKVIDEVRDCVELFDKLNDVLTASWDLMYEKAKAYYEENGSLEVPQRYITADGYSLGSWVSAQRAIRAGTMNGTLTQEQIRKLNAIGMVWESRTDVAWAKNYKAAQDYAAEHGNLNVPADYVSENGAALGAWLKMLRKWKSAGIHQKYLTKDRIADLDAIGMAWDLHDYYWEQMYQKAVKYYRAHGNLDVPNKYVTEDGIRLGAWVHRQRSAYRTQRDISSKDSGYERDGNVGGTETGTFACRKAGETEEDRIQRLNAIGMVWSDGHEANWDRNYELAKEYYRMHGNLSMPKKYQADGQNLGYWVNRQKSAYRAGTLSDRRRRKLEAIGIGPETDTWESRIRLAKKYLEENDVRCISQGVVIDGIWIGKWLAVQRKALEAGKLSSKQKKLLEGIPMRTKGEEAWENAYALAKEYYEEHGNLDVPKKYISRNGYGLGNWVSYQRKLRREGNLLEEQVRRLDEIGFAWEPRKAAV